MESFVPAIISPVIYVVLLPLVFVIWLVNEFGRCIIRTVLWLQHRGRISLVEDASDAAWNYQLRGNTKNVLLLGVTRRQNFNLEVYARMFEKSVLQYEERENVVISIISGHKTYRPYRKLESAISTSYGYSCWRRDSKFDVRRHFRFVHDPQTLYRDEDIQKLMEDLGNDMDECRPQWEWIFIPLYQDPEGMERSALIFRYHHCYMDGMSLLLMFGLRLGNGGENFTMNPVSSNLYLRLKMLLYLKTVVLGPFMLLKILLSRGTHYWNMEGPFPGEVKTYLRTPPIPLTTLKKIQSDTQASISNIISKGFITASKKILGETRVPPSVRVAEMVAVMPYRNPAPQNKFAAFSYDVLTEDDEDWSTDGFSRKSIGELRKCRLSRMGGAEPLLYLHVLTYLGLLPTFIPSLALHGVYNSLILSNIPAFREKISCFGEEILQFCAWPPNANQTGITIACTSYDGQMTITGVCDSSWIKPADFRRIFAELSLVINSFEASRVIQVRGGVWGKMKTSLSFVHELNKFGKNGNLD